MFIMTCPTCRKHAAYERREDAVYRPFCSERCKLIDLGKWLNEEYRISEPLPGDENGETTRKPLDE